MNPNLVFLLSLIFVLLGYALKKIGVLGAADSRSISRILMTITLPALIFRTIVSAEIGRSLIVLPFAAIGYGILVCSVLLFVNRKAAPEDKAIYSMGSIGFNNGMFAYPIIEGIYGAAGLGYLAIFDIGSGLSVFGLSYMLAAYFNAKRAHGNFRMTFATFFRLIFKSIPFVTYLVAIAWNLLKIPVPSFMDACLAVPARANMFLVLILIGLHLEFSLKEADKKKIFQILGLRYSLGITLGIIVFLLPISNEVLHTIAGILFILPVSMAIIPYSALFEFDTKTAGALVNYSIIVSFILMWAGISLSQIL